eukprot:1490746-Amphidinium_carterae.1
MMHAIHAVNAGPNFPDLPAITHGYWGFIVPQKDLQIRLFKTERSMMVSSPRSWTVSKCSIPS